jgi:hypothetical protein
MNLLLDIPQENLIYPILKFNSNGKTKPKVLGIADCYYQQMYYSPIIKNCFDTQSSLWFYYKRSYERSEEKKMDQINKHETIINQDVIIIMHTNHTLKQFGYGFLDELEKRIELADKDYKSLPNIFNEKEINKIINKIKENQKWFENVKKQAIKRNISIDNMLRKSAIYTINQRENK